MFRTFACALSLSTALLLQLSACSKSAPATQAAEMAGEVDVVTVAVTELPAEAEFPGRVEAYRIAEVRARVSGIVSRRQYQEGQTVKAGTLLFSLNPEQLQASKLGAEAELARAEANLFNAQDKFQRYQALMADQSVSQRDFHAAEAEVQLAKAEVVAAQAKLKRAKLDLSYASVTAPIDGVARRALVTEGALVGKDEATHLMTIEQVDPVYVNFSQSSAEVFALRKAVRDGALKQSDGSFKMTLILPDGSVYPHPGKLSFADVSVNQNTDSVSMRAIFDNPQQVLMPGAYVRLSVRQATNPHAILIPRDALIRDQFSSRVWVVNHNNQLESHEVKAGRMVDRQWVIEQGLQPGEQVVVTNVAAQKAGATVRTRQVRAQDRITKALAS